MERHYVEFVSAEELELFMSRYMVAVYDDRLYLRKSCMQVLSTINKVSNVSFDSVLPDDFTSNVFEYMRRRHQEIYTSGQSSPVLIAKCDGCKRSTLFDDFPCIAVHFTSDDASDTFGPLLKSYLNFMHCFLSLAVSLYDPWSAVRILNKVCPEVLPALRRSAQKSMGNLNIIGVSALAIPQISLLDAVITLDVFDVSYFLKVLISYIMTATVDDYHNGDVEFRANYHVLKQFIDTVVAMNEILREDMQPNEAVKSAVNVATKFMAVIPNCTNSSVMTKMITYLNRNIEQLSTNFRVMNSTVMNNKYQTKTSNQTSAYVIAISLCDRLACLNVIENIGVISPLFKTPKNKAVVSSPISSVGKKALAEKNDLTPEIVKSRIADFISIDTPVLQSLNEVDNYGDVTVSMKENISIGSEILEKKSYCSFLRKVSPKTRCTAFVTVLAARRLQFSSMYLSGAVLIQISGADFQEKRIVE
uniref:Uncharacterized protein n=1 Tax=Setaria digitata TaxID=48799 RepID=A0A915PNI2_9BILA